MEKQVTISEDLAVTLQEFDDALHDFSRGPCDSEERLKQLKKQLQSSCDSGISDSESCISSKGSSRCTSEENLNNYSTNSNHAKAKLGDTQELENFIADLDKVLNDL
ncbi:regulator of cell cycle RGCC [Bombina bombina]|uniref:regulator of cell cycle RGCC n=1 Tax=Bombina bombina TaxID=8345 RepID=UPI00235A6E7A|nr:regulator of cell cycle RGCC [Bombina bombina]